MFKLRYRTERVTECQQNSDTAPFLDFVPIPSDDGLSRKLSQDRMCHKNVHFLAPLIRIYSPIDTLHLKLQSPIFTNLVSREKKNKNVAPSFVSSLFGDKNRQNMKNRTVRKYQWKAL